MIDIFNSCGNSCRIGGEKKVPGKDKCETLDVIPLMLLVRVNTCQPTLHMSKRTVNFYSTDKTINQFAIGYMIIQITS